MFLSTSRRFGYTSYLPAHPQQVLVVEKNKGIHNTIPVVSLQFRVLCVDANARECSLSEGGRNVAYSQGQAMRHLRVQLT